MQGTNTHKVTMIADALRLSMLAALAILVMSVLGLQAAPAAPARPPQIPALHWQQRSDWINVKTDITPAAVGDGKADDTAALQKAFDGIKDGSVLYFPAGTYRITATLSLRNPTGARWMGGLLIGCGRNTRLLWDGPAGHAMLRLNGIAYTRIVGFELDGRGKAGIGFHYRATQGFQTEVTHRHLAFRGFTNAGVLEDHLSSEQALAETTFENCLFEECERGVAFLQFNDYNYTFDGCEFRRCGVGLDCAHGNFYVRNCHFEGSRVVDIRDGSEHGSSIRRCTSTGSNAFISRLTTVAPLTIQDCHVDGWKNPQGAILLSRPPVMLFDCVFTNPPQSPQGVGLPPLRVHSDGQRLLVSENRVSGASGLIQAGPRPQLYVIPRGQRKGVLRSAQQRFLHVEARIPQRVFDARRDFAARGDGVTDDTEAIQKCIHAAAAASKQAIAYLPTGRYVISRTLHITGKDYFVGGSGWGTKLVWKGPAGGTMVEVRAPQHVVLEDMMIGSHDAGDMNNGIDILQIGSHHPSHMTYDGVYVFGMYQKQPLRKGLWFTGLGENEVVVMPHVQGNLHFLNCGAATILANCTYEGSVVVEGKKKERKGMLGFQTRLATGVTHGLYLRDNHSIVMSDFYTESADNGFFFQGAPDDPPGRAVIQGAKVHFPTSDDPTKNTAFDIRHYRGQIVFGPDQFYGEPKRMRLRQQGAEPLELFLLGCSWYGPEPDVMMTSAARLFILGNEAYGTSPPIGSLYGDGTPEAALSKVSHALDELRRLGEQDMKLNHRQAPPVKSAR